MMLRIVRLLAFLGLTGVTLYYWMRTGGHLLTSRDAANHISLAAVVWALTLLRKGRPADAEHLQGSARWATARDLHGLLRRRAALRPGALLLGRFGRRSVVVPPELSPQHALVVGPAGTGKTRTLFMPNAALATGSFVVTDPKGELWMHTSGYHDHAWRFAPREPEASRCCNWIPLCADTRTADLLAAAAMQSDRQGGGDPFWGLAEAQVCSALFAHTATLPAPTPATAYALLGSGPRGLLAAFRDSKSLGARQCAAMLGDLRGEMLASIVLGVSNRLAWLKEPAVQRFTSANLEPPDFRVLAQEPTAVYWVLHEQDVALLQPLSAIFFTLLLDQLGSTALETPVLLLLDEFANLGVLPRFPTTISVARGRGIALVLGVQALSQLDGLYGRAGAETIRVNCAAKVILHGLDYAGAAEVSRSLGEQTVTYQPRTSDASRWSEQHVRRSLLTADEVRRIGNDELVLLVSNRHPARLRKQWWTARPRTAETTGLGVARVWTPPDGDEQTAPAPRRNLARRGHAED